MSPSSESWTIRRPTVDDAPAVVDLMNACDAAEYGEPDSDLGDLRHEWTQIDLAVDAWLAFTPGGDLAGYASVFEGGGTVDFDIYVHPMCGDAELRELLVHECEARAKVLHAKAPKPDSTARTIVSQVNEAQRATLEVAGYEPAKYYLRMQIELDDLPETFAWPDGCTLRTVIPEQDDRSVYDLIQKAFERPGRTAPGFETWRDSMMRPDLFDAGLPFLWRDRGLARNELHPVWGIASGRVRALGKRVQWEVGSTRIIH